MSMSRDGTRPLAGQRGDGAYDLAPSAGRELDALVAEKVMGWKRCRDALHATDNRVIGGIAYCYPGLDDGRYSVRDVPFFSTDIAAAWLIVEHLQKTRNLSFVLATNACANGHQNGAKFFEGFRGLGHDIFDCARHEGWSAVDESIPRAICLAALTAAERLEKAAAVKATVDAHAAAPGRADD